ncbi:MAG: heavy metal-binding domain-containing protein [Clostridium sp.]|nr:heavy metal-binding domain-containing protein [Clostridium sp.]MCM1398149.1 heavy metal-binding domain-containing protein [Clostridium sp.]MCM1460850.1 heavy metal-binding domain-containing protein [Bacteroides sp.]
MGELMITSGSGFEGYEIDQYLGFVSGQTVLGSNFFKGIAAGVTEMSDAESEKLTSKLEQANEVAMNKLIKLAESRKADAIIGTELNYTQFANYSVGTIASGTAVTLRKLEDTEHKISKELYVSNYYNRLVPRPVKVILSGDSKEVKICTQFFNYNMDDIKAIRADIELTNLYEEKLLLKNLDFVFEKGNVTLITANEIECKLPAKDILLIKDSKVTISKYVTSRGVFACNDVPINVSMPLHRLSALKEKRGIDAVEKYRTDGMTWTCNCGYVNEAGSEECVVCARKQEDMKSTSTFNPDEMIAKMQTKEFVMEIKDVLMEYIKDIDTQYRMELLEIMESGLQYEKTRGNMKDTVIEKVEKVFEGH